ncbi:MAG: ABC transporter ATP-binding protein [Acidimicrobiia bacterium]|nr:ABC transporter ATP-binding protein [Acidimicrobiia bacterium]
MSAIEIEGLVKRYGSLEAVAGVSLTVEVGEVFALLGPNGAGKTTTVEILEGHRTRDGGSVSVLGVDPAVGGRAYRERIGIVLQSSGLDRQLSVSELLHLYAPMYPHPRPVDEVIEIVGLADKADARVKTLSGGQTRRLDLALGIIGDPDLIFLDEPTTGFDPSARRKSWTLIDGLRTLGKTILLTTHYMDEAQHLADRVAVMANGRIVAEGTPDEIGGRDAGSVRVWFALPAGTALAELPAPFDTAHLLGGVVEATVADPTRALHRLTSWAMERSIDLPGLTVTRPSLEDVYLALTDETSDE